MKATCLNDSCERGSWTLRKHPDEYSGSGPQCPECGTTRVRVGGEQKPQQTQEVETYETRPPAGQTQTHAPAQPPARQQTTQPANPQQGQPSAQGGLPANQRDANQLQKGAEIADALSGLGSNDPTERADAKMDAGRIGAGLVYRAFQNSAQADRERAQRARERGAESNLQTTEPDICPECGVEIIDPPEGKFYCPGCSAVLEVATQASEDPQGTQPEPEPEPDSGDVGRGERTYNGPGEM